MDVTYPIGQLEVPNNATMDDVANWLSDIATYTDRLRETVDGLSEEQLEKRYRIDSWNVRELVHHIADSQLNMYQRLKMALTANNPVIYAFDQDKWIEHADNRLPVECSIKMLEGINERIVALGKTLTNEDLLRTFTLHGNGEVTVAAKLKKLNWHEEHHLAHIHIALDS
ncbi:YfiT family bacillithiol transferase [Pseudogracilibacillus sp. ICA-222130]|uniref:YfiT family bacillithiol transferase n=1 Tax=Pseudogracilibacillus sp. ICA-222130 TaxID=3134655 RepID=UPI0030BFCA44